MRPRAPHFAAAVGLASWLMSPTGVAQRQPLLDLGAAPRAPAPGQGAGVLALAEELRKQADEVEHKPGAAARERAMGGARKLARALLTTGEQMGDKGSQRNVMGRTLARGMAGIDRVIAACVDQTPETGNAEVALAARDMLAAAAGVENQGADAWRLVRDGLAGLTQAASRQGSVTGAFGWIDQWTEQDGPLAGDVDAWVKAPGVTPVTGQTIRELDALAESGLAWPAYRAPARHLRVAVRGGAGLLGGGPAWIPDTARRSLGEQFSVAIKQLATEADRDAGITALRRLARLGVLAARVDTLDDNPAVKRVRSALVQAMSAPDTEARQLEAFDRVLDLDLARGKLPDEKALIRQVRPAWRVLGAGLKASEQKLEGALPEVLTHVDAMTDPGVASIIASHRRAIQDMEVLASLNTAMIGDAAPGTRASAEPAVAERWKRVADRVFKLGQELSKPDTKDTALTALRQMAQEIGNFTTLPGEESLREAVRLARLAAEKNEPPPNSAWSVLTGGKASALLSEISDRRGGWLAGWDKAGYAGSKGDVERLAALRGLMAVLEDAAAITTAGDADFIPAYAALQAWPGWELSDDGFRAIAGGLSGQTAGATLAIVNGDAGKCASLVETIRSERAAALLAGRLAREGAGRGLKALGLDGAALYEVGAGGPGAGWMAASADEIADVCRYAEEAAVARKLGAKDRAEEILKFVNARAEKAYAQIAEVTQRAQR